jgi:hypothetical protein
MYFTEGTFMDIKLIADILKHLLRGIAENAVITTIEDDAPAMAADSVPHYILSPYFEGCRTIPM